MTATDPAAVGSRGLGGPADARRRKLLRRLLQGLGALAVLAVAALITIGIAAAHYQPLSYGSTGNSAELYPGIRAGHGIHAVNNVGGFHEDIYIPPQRRVFSLFVDVRNNGSYPVTIEAVTLPLGGPRLAGRVRYSTPGMGGSNEIPPPTSRPLHDFVLRPGQEMFIGLPVRTWPCAQTGGWSAVTAFYVQMRFLGFTRSVALPWGSTGDSLIMHIPGGRPGDPGTFCLPHTALPKPPPDNQPAAVAGTILRIHKHAHVGELRLTQMTAPDAASLSKPYPACMLSHAPGQRVVNFDLNWAGIDFGQQGPTPGVRISITGPAGEPVTALIPAGSAATITCEPASSLVLSSEGSGWQLVYGLILRLPLRAALHTLIVQWQSPRTVETSVVVILRGERAVAGAPRAAGGRRGLPVLPA